MKHVPAIFCALFVFQNLCMEKSPRDLVEPSYDCQELAQVHHIMYCLESEASYANPHAPARIYQASDELLSLANKSLISFAWSKSCARSNAANLLEKSAHMIARNQGTSLAHSSELLYQQAQHIFTAIQTVHEKIERLKTNSLS